MTLELLNGLDVYYKMLDDCMEEKVNHFNCKKNVNAVSKSKYELFYIVFIRSVVTRKHTNCCVLDICSKFGSDAVFLDVEIIF